MKNFLKAAKYSTEEKVLKTLTINWTYRAKIILITVNFTFNDLSLKTIIILNYTYHSIILSLRFKKKSMKITSF